MVPQVYPALDGTNRLILNLNTGMDGECVYLKINEAEYLRDILERTINFVVERELNKGKQNG